MFAHDFKDQLFVYRKTQLIHRFQGHFDDPLGILLSDVCNAASLQMLSQQHAERQGRRRIRRIFCNEMEPGVVAGRGSVQAAVPLPGVYVKDQLIWFRLVYFFYFPKNKGIFQFIGCSSRNNAIKSHSLFTSFSNFSNTIS